jgi:hypothetical protein
MRASIDQTIGELEDRIAGNTEQTLGKILAAFEVIDFKISTAKVFEVAQCLLKDLHRLKVIQNDAVADTKYAAYWAFWVRKLKPISYACRKTVTGTVELTDINERAALEFAVTMLKRSGRHSADRVRSKCRAACDGGGCIDRYLAMYFTHDNNAYSEYIIYSLGKRTFGPHHLSAILDAILFASCADPGGASVIAPATPVND